MRTISYPPELPITSRRDEIVDALRTHRVLIVAGETGSGKTTQLPKMCLEAGLDRTGKIGCTQPRRVAAMSISRRVAEELGATWGREVGCKIRFNDDTGPETRVKFMTDGMLLAEIQSDPRLSAYSTLIIDEAHERSLNIDFLLGYLQGLLRRRNDLHIIITSATIDTEAFSRAFGGAPVIEVSGRLFPVEIRYIQPDARDSESEASAEDGGYIEAAARLAEDALIEADSGDVLVFMPTERDIRETRDLLEGRLGSEIEVLGLFGRMPGADQQRIFSPGPRRRVVVATNIAETSITIPRIAVVIDTGLSRVSRYNPRTRTKRLPIEPIAQSSANQRAGRAGRVRDGLCLRLYAEDDFAERPRFSQPEIQRANLAEVILRMKAFRLGEIETFPFLNPPAAAAIRGGYVLLYELGAITETNELTPLGRELARLPIDPTLGRMLLQARQEKALPEILVIAAGSSVPDPRERPEDAREAAAAAHRAFADPASDFLSLLAIWRAAPPPDKASHNALRRFCKTHYLSLSRMREWREIYRQLCETIADENETPPKRSPEQSYDAVHRSVLAGLLGHIALKEDRNTYKAAGDRLVTIFPGSNLYERREKNAKAAPVRNSGKTAPDKNSRQPLWIVAGEIVETSQLFARMTARIDPLWVAELGAHLCKYRYSEPHWSARAGRVLVTERALVHGLEVSRRKVDHGRIDPEQATELFIRGALIAQESNVRLRFFAENRALREKIETALTRVRSGRVLDLDEAFYRFYAQRLQRISSLQDLDRMVGERLAKEPNFLCATEEALLGSTDLSYDKELFPDQVSVHNSVLPLTYAYAPGTDQDGVTVHVPLPVAEHLTDGEIQWMAPSLREEQIAVLLRALPKTVRRPLMPLEAKAREVAQSFQPGKDDFLTALAAFLSRKYGVTIRAEDWPAQSLPDYLRPRVVVVDRQRRTVAEGRGLDSLREKLDSVSTRSDAWERAAQRWERHALAAWSFGDLPEAVTVEEVNGVPLLAYPGLSVDEGEAGVRLFRKADEAAKSSPPGVRRLAELALARDLAWLQKELRSLAAKWLPRDQATGDFGAALQALSRNLTTTTNQQNAFTTDGLAAAAGKHIGSHLFRLEPLFPLTETRFRTMIEATRRELPLIVRRVSELASEILGWRQRLLAAERRSAGWDGDLQRLVPPDFLAQTPHAQLAHLPRYLKAMQIRGERAWLNPAKDAEKAKQLAPFAQWQTRVPENERETFRWLLEEFRVSLFAQELGVAQRVSAQRLQALGGW